VKARAYLAKLDPNVSGQYDTLKQALLREFKLTPNSYLERFNRCAKNTDDTYVTFASKLNNLLDYYLDSREVTTFEQLRNLLICDKIKSGLSESCLNYVLSIESATKTGWLGMTELVDAVDRYSGSHTQQDKPKAFAVGQTSYQMSKPNPQKVGFRPGSNGNGGGANRSNSKSQNTRVARADSIGAIKRCYHCQSTLHLRNACPNLKRSENHTANVRRVCMEKAISEPARLEQAESCGRPSALYRPDSRQIVSRVSRVSVLGATN